MVSLFQFHWKPKGHLQYLVSISKSQDSNLGLHSLGPRVWKLTVLFRHILSQWPLSGSTYSQCFTPRKILLKKITIKIFHNSGKVFIFAMLREI